MYKQLEELVAEYTKNRSFWERFLKDTSKFVDGITKCYGTCEDFDTVYPVTIEGVNCMESAKVSYMIYLNQT